MGYFSDFSLWLHNLSTSFFFFFFYFFFYVMWLSKDLQSNDTENRQ